MKLTLNTSKDLNWDPIYKKTKTLVVIDFQKDFCNPNGSLYVPGAEEAEQAIVDYIVEFY